MIASVRRNLNILILKHTSPLYSRSPLPFSLPLQFFSTISATLLHKYDFPPELASKLTHLENSQKVDSVLSFFKETGFSNTQLVKIVRYRPQFLAASVEDSLMPKIKLFRDFGFSSDAILKIISSNPAILHLSVDNNIIPSLSEMKGLLGSNDEVIRVLKSSPRFLTVNLKNSVMPNVEFFKSCGIPMERILMVIGNFPNPFLLKPEVTRKSAEKVREMGLDASSKSFIYAIPTIASMSNEAWEVKLQGLRDMGCSDSDILTMFRKAPRVFMVSVDKMRKIKELLFATGKFNISSIVNCPKTLENSIEKRYKPRLQILEILESRNLIKNWPGLGTIALLSDDKFSKKFIRPYLDEVSEVCIPKNFSRS